MRPKKKKTSGIRVRVVNSCSCPVDIYGHLCLISGGIFISLSFVYFLCLLNCLW